MVGVRQFDEDAAFSDALDVFWRKGYRATSMIDLAEATGVQRGSLYNAYGDKEAIFLQVFDRYTARFVADARKALDKPELRDALIAFFDFAIRSIMRGSPARGCLSTKTAIESDAESPQVRAAVQHMLDTLGAVIVEALESDRAAAQLCVPPRQAADVIVAMTRGIAVMERVHGDSKRLKQTAATLVDALVRRK